MKLLLSIILNGVAVWLGAYLFSGVYVEGFLYAIITGIILALVNVTLKPILKFLTLPITILTLGLFLLVINGLMVLLVDWILNGFDVENFLWAVIFSIYIWVINWILEGLNLK